ncbi:AAA domain-containing protein [Spiroplasma sp. SV19]|uniref:AAA domain-containing protein n=1 Tax=Spiroplasma sp. SV19 TaxID=2570468 RepID=UPI0024B6E05B|nr:AAA domain-containing protein [Spiroplasma sp. SV19]WHQ36901.1 DUF4011 domain-containing protein [Spiroplasma sp. SV19]
MNIQEIKERVVARSKNSLANFVDLKRQSFRVIDLFEIKNYLGNQNLFQELLMKGNVSLNFLNKNTDLKPNLSILTDYETDKIYEKNNKIDVNDDINEYIRWRKNELYNKLLKLSRTNAESLRETGISHLKIGFPFVSGTYYDENNKLDYYRGPLFFFNVMVEQLSNKFVINWDQTINPNINLLSRLGYFLKIDLTKEIEELENDENDNSSIFEIIKNKYDLMLKIFREKLGIDFPNLEFTEEFELMKFPFKSESLTTLKRKGENIVTTLAFSALIGFYKTESAELIHDLDNWENSEEYFNELENQLSNRDSVDKNYNPIKAMGEIVQISELDFSQKLAISSALKKNLVINGPPGTGKSQTIVNLLINILSNSKKALFCAEKRVATEVVYNRLKHFQTFALLIYDLKNDKKLFINQLRKSFSSLIMWSSQSVKPTIDISAKISNLLNKISNFHDVLATADAQMYINDLTKYSGKVSDEIVTKVKDYKIFSNILLNNFDEQYQEIKTYFQASDYYDYLLAKSKIVKNFTSFKKIVNFNWNAVTDRELVIVQYYLTNKLRNKVSFWNKRKVKKYYNSNTLNSEFSLFDEFINEYQYLGKNE